MGYIDSMYDVMNMETALLKYIVSYFEENYQPEIKILDAKLPVIDKFLHLLCLRQRKCLVIRLQKINWI